MEPSSFLQNLHDIMSYLFIQLTQTPRFFPTTRIRSTRDKTHFQVSDLFKNVFRVSKNAQCMHAAYFLNGTPLMSITPSNLSAPLFSLFHRCTWFSEGQFRYAIPIRHSVLLFSTFLPVSSSFLPSIIIAATNISLIYISSRKSFQDSIFLISPDFYIPFTLWIL